MPEQDDDKVIAQERRTRTPIRFKKDIHSTQGTGVGGLFTPPSKSIADTITNYLTSKTPGITIDPSAINDVGTTIRHEGVHALMNQYNVDPEALASQIPMYQQIASKFPHGYGNPAAEVPALAATGELGNMYHNPIPQDWIDTYHQQLQDRLFQMNPNLGKIYSQFSQGGQQQ